MDSVEIRSDLIIKSRGVAQEALNNLLGVEVDFDRVLNYMRGNPEVLYIDERLNWSKTIQKETVYAWVFTGFVHNSHPVFISMLRQQTDKSMFRGSFVGKVCFLGLSLLKVHPEDTLFIRRNMDILKTLCMQKFKARLHINTCMVASEKEDTIADTQKVELQQKEASTSEVTKECNLNTGSETESKAETPSNFYARILGLAREIKEELLIDTWETTEGLARYLKIIGARVEQLITENGDNNTSFIVNDSGSFIVNSGLLNKFSDDIYLLYEKVDTVDRYACKQVINGKGDMVRAGFSKELINSKELEPLKFCKGDGLLRNVTIDDIDFNIRGLTHILLERRERFTSEIQQYPVEILAEYIKSSLEMGLKLLARDATYAKPTYSGKTQELSWCMPLHIKSRISDKPELALVLVFNKYTDFYEIKTILPYDALLRDKCNCLMLYHGQW